jgi:hypothetical protein
LRAGKALHFSWRDGKGEGERERERRGQNIGIKSIQEDRKEEVLKEREGMGLMLKQIFSLWLLLCPIRGCA